jgi:hypothetical protein
MANIVVQSAPERVLVINQTTDKSDEYGVITTNLRITDNLNHLVYLVAVDRGLPGIQGIKGDAGDQGESGPQGERGLQGTQGERGIPGSGINELLVNSVSLSGISSSLSIVGSGSTLVWSNNNSKTVTIGTPPLNFAPEVHGHTASQISQLSEFIDDRIGGTDQAEGLLKSGSGINIQYEDDQFNRLTISVTGLVPGKDIQSYSNSLSNIASLNFTFGDMIYATGTNKFGKSYISPSGRLLVSKNSIGDQRDFLGLGSIVSYNSGDYAKINGGNSLTGDQNFGDGKISRFSAQTNTVSATGYNIVQSDNGKTVLFTSDSVINVGVIDSNINVGFNCLIVQLGSGQVICTGVNLYNRASHFNLVGKYSMATLFKPTNYVTILSGDTTNLLLGDAP